MMTARTARILAAITAMFSLAVVQRASAGTVAYWQLDEASGNLIDVVGGNNFPAGSGYTYSQTALVNPVPNPNATAGSANTSSIDFSGTSNAPQLTGAANDPFELLDTRSFTFEGWVQHNITDGTQSGIEQLAGDRHTSAYRGWAMWVNNGLPQFYYDMGTPRTYVQATTRIDDGNPHHFAAVWDHANLDMKLYVDGVEEGTMLGDVAALSNSANYNTSDAAFAIGARNTGGSTFNDSALNGRLDELRFSDEVLAPSQLLNAVGSTVAYWQFDNATTGTLTGSGLADSVGNHHLNAVSGTFASSAVGAVDPVPNPDTSPTFSGVPSANPDSGLRPSLFANGSADTDRLIAGNDTGNVFNLSGKDFTFEGWFQHEAASISSGYGDLIGGTRDAGGGYMLRMLPSGSISAYFAEAGGGVDEFTISTSGADYRGGSGDFHHFALAWRDGGGANSTGLAGLYIDGVLEAVGSAPAGFNAATADGNDVAFRLAGRAASSANKWDGRFDEFRFSNQALSPVNFLNATADTVVPEPAVLVDINADGTNRNATTTHFETAAGLPAGTFILDSVTHFPNNDPGGGAFSQTVNDITIAVSDISNDADGWFGAGSDNNLLEDGLYHRDTGADPSALITLSGSGLGLDPLTAYELYLFAGRSQGHETSFTFDANDLLDPSGGVTIDVGAPVPGGDNTLGTALFTFETGWTAPSSLVIQWDGLRNIDGNQDAVFSGFALRNMGAVVPGAVIPEPASLALVLLGMTGLLLVARRRRG